MAKKSMYTKSGRQNKTTLKGASRTTAQKKASRSRVGKKLRYWGAILLKQKRISSGLHSRKKVYISIQLH